MLRDYQIKGKELIKESFQKGNKAVMGVMPCGTGKSTWASSMVADAISRGKKCVFNVHRKELVMQFHDRLKSQFGIDSGIVMVGHPRTNHPIQVCSIQSLLRRELPPGDLVFFDEAHRIKASSWMKILEQYPDAYKIFLTATPERLDGKGFKDIVDDIVVPITAQEAIQSRWLVPTETYAPLDVGLDGVRTRAGEYNTADLFEVFMEDRVIKGVFDGYMQYMEGKKVIVYNVNVELSKVMSAYFKKKNIAAAHIDGSTSKNERDKILRDFKTGKVKVLCNVQILTEGFDVPDCEGVILNVATKSKSKFIQCVGRAQRPVWDGADWKKENGVYFKEKALILDFGGNTVRHGVADYYGSSGFTLDEKKKGIKFDDTGKKCPECLMVVAPSTKVCQCGYKFPAKKDDKLYADEVNIQKIEHFDNLVYKWLTMSMRDVEREPAEYLRTIAIVRGYDWRWALWKAYHKRVITRAPKNGINAKDGKIQLEKLEREKGTYKFYLMAKNKFK